MNHATATAGRNQAPTSPFAADDDSFPLGPSDLDDEAAMRALRDDLDALLAAASGEACAEAATRDRAQAARRVTKAVRGFRHAPATALDDSGSFARLGRYTLPSLVIHRGAAFLLHPGGRVEIVPHQRILNADAAG